tara:strand:- start:841 stop:1014 length:174 start_codon:yes stop_codon:yes gene_type:complete
MLNADKYINRLRVAIKDDESLPMEHDLHYLRNRVKDIIRDYDRDFNKAMEEMEKQNV